MDDSAKHGGHSTREVGGLVTVRFGRKGSPYRDAVEELKRMGEAADPVAVALNQMICVAVKEYVERHRKRKAGK